MGDATMKRTTWLFLIACLLIPIVHALPQPIIIYGNLTGPCVIGANISCTSYWGGFMGDTSRIYQEDFYITDGSYFNPFGKAVMYVCSLNYLDDLWPGGTPWGADIEINVSNPACGASFFGEVLQYNQTSSFEKYVNVNATSTFTTDIPVNSSFTNDNTTFLDWTVDSTDALNYTLFIDDEISVSSPFVQQIANIGASSYTLNSSQALPDDDYYWRVLAYDSRGYWAQVSGLGIFTVTTIPPNITSVSPANRTWRNNPNVALQVTTDKPAECRYANNSGVPFANKAVMAGGGTQIHTANVVLPNQGPHNDYFFQCNDSAGNLNPSEVLLSLYLDSMAPDPSNASVLIAGGAYYATSTTLTFTWSGFTDPGYPENSTNITSYIYSFNNNGGTAIGTFDPSSPGSLSSAPQGNVSVYVWARDSIANYGLAVSDWIYVDSIAPQFENISTSPMSLWFNYTGNYTVTLTINDNLNGSPAFRYWIGNDTSTIWANMTSLGGNNYRISVPNQAAPNDWFNRRNEYLNIEMNATDVAGVINTTVLQALINIDNTAPVMGIVGNKVAYEDQLLRFNVTASDAENNTLTFTSNQTGISVVKYTNNLAGYSWTPTASQVGLHAVNISVSDGVLHDEEIILITVIETNDAPILEEMGTLTAYLSQYFEYQINASDPENDPMFYTSNSTLFNVDYYTGLIGYYPQLADAGSYHFNFTVEDDQGLADSEMVTFNVRYCGDGICTSYYENVSACPMDCESSAVQEQLAVLIYPRNCINSSFQIKSVKLVERATCDVKGRIINGMEVCGNMSDATIKVYNYTKDKYLLYDEMITDSYGDASFYPERLGWYKIEVAKGGYTTVLGYAHVNDCIMLGRNEPTIPISTTEPEETKEPSKPSVIEKPEAEPGETMWQLVGDVLIMVAALVLLPIIIVLGALVGAYYIIAKYFPKIRQKVDEYIEKALFAIKLKYLSAVLGFYDPKLKRFGVVYRNWMFYRVGFKGKCILLSKDEPLGKIADTSIIMVNPWKYKIVNYAIKEPKAEPDNILMRVEYGRRGLIFSYEDMIPVKIIISEEDELEKRVKEAVLNRGWIKAATGFVSTRSKAIFLQMKSYLTRK